MSSVSALTTVIHACAAVLILGVVASAGMTVVVALIASGRRGWLVACGVAAHVIAMPAVAWVMVRGMPVNAGGIAGLTLVAIGGAGSAGLRASRLVRRGEVPAAVATVIVLQLVDVVAVPISASGVADGATRLDWVVGRNLVSLVVVPLVIGALLVLRYRASARRRAIAPDRVATIAVAIALVAGIATNWDTVVSVRGSGLVMAAVCIALVVGGAVALFGIGPEGTSVPALLSGTRLVVLVLIIIGASGGGSVDYLAPATVYSLADLTVMLLIACEIHRRLRSSPSSGRDDAIRIRSWPTPVDGHRR